MSETTVPTHQELALPVLDVLQEHGGSAQIQEIRTAMTERFPEDVAEVLHNEGPETEVEYRSAWALSYLKMDGAVNNPTRGLWILTDEGRKLIGADLEIIKSRFREVDRRRRRNRGQAQPTQLPDQEGGTASPTEPLERVAIDETLGDAWREEVLEHLRGLSPEAFERLCQLMLRARGFTDVEVTGRTGDGGIDGTGVLRINLISFRVMFQCKRYRKEPVGSPAIRQFQGATQGRGDKGLFLTTGRFTADARLEAVRDGALAVDLIDGNDLCDLLKDLNLGIRTETKEEVSVLPEFFASV